MKTCCQCKKEHDVEAMVQFGEEWVCEDCKPEYVQKLKEGFSETDVDSIGSPRPICPVCGKAVPVFSGRTLPPSEPTVTCAGCGTELVECRRLPMMLLIKALTVSISGISLVAVVTAAFDLVKSGMDPEIVGILVTVFVVVVGLCITLLLGWLIHRFGRYFVVATEALIAEREQE